MENPLSIWSGIGIRKRIFLVPLIIIPLPLLETFVFYKWFHSRKSVEMQTNLELGGVVICFETFLEDLPRNEMTLALTPFRPLTDKNQDRMLDRLVGEILAFAASIWLNPAVPVIASSSRPFIGINLSDRSYFLKVATGTGASLIGKQGMQVSRFLQPNTNGAGLKQLNCV